MKALVGVTAAVGIAAGGPVGAAVAAPTAVQQSGSAQVAPLAVVNLGLSKAQAKDWQCALRGLGYRVGTIDGLLGSDSWKAAQRFFRDHNWYNDDIDGIVGPNTVMGLQRMLNVNLKAGLDVDGVAGPATQAAFAKFANLYRDVC
ncbi:peptidoglycan-binding domain-containing protein [Streptomyces sp. CRN 30]|uniref:peptidoglycan-binding domain-containing protein n=1 Tax=Streptomyces sp. CRN 30 TaxID=3075613 RepID=UPI002A82B679|nr:peptidoglycan-binding domain-containing protein [Streptomyces sp. CRN 30]